MLARLDPARQAREMLIGLPAAEGLLVPQALEVQLELARACFLVSVLEVQLEPQALVAASVLRPKPRAASVRRRAQELIILKLFVVFVLSF